MRSARRSKANFVGCEMNRRDMIFTIVLMALLAGGLVMSVSALMGY